LSNVVVASLTVCGSPTRTGAPTRRRNRPQDGVLMMIVSCRRPPVRGDRGGSWCSRGSFAFVTAFLTVPRRRGRTRLGRIVEPLSTDELGFRPIGRPPSGRGPNIVLSYCVPWGKVHDTVRPPAPRSRLPCNRHGCLRRLRAQPCLALVSGLVAPVRRDRRMGRAAPGSAGIDAGGGMESIAREPIFFTEAMTATRYQMTQDAS